MHIVGIAGSIFIGIGCFFPWMQIGIYSENGLSNEGSYVLLIASMISGVVGVFNQTRNENKNLWIYIVTGITGLVVILIFILELHPKSKEISGVLIELSKMIGGNKSVTVMNLLGPGLYLVVLGSIGLILSGLNVIRPDDIKATKINATQNFDEIRINPIVIVNDEYRNEVIKLKDLISKEKENLFEQSNRNQLIAALKKLCNDVNEANHLLKVYQQLFKSDLVEDIKSTSSSYDRIRNLLDPLIALDLIDRKFPHYKKGEPNSKTGQ